MRRPRSEPSTPPPAPSPLPPEELLDRIAARDAFADVAWAAGSAPDALAKGRVSHMSLVAPAVDWARVRWYASSKDKAEFAPPKRRASKFSLPASPKASAYLSPKRRGLSPKAEKTERDLAPSQSPEPIGIGQMAFVAAARVGPAADDDALPAVAVKILKKNVAADPREAACFAREVALLARLRHPNLLRCHGCGAAAGGRPFCVLDLLEGTVSEILNTAACGTNPRDKRRVDRKWPVLERLRLCCELAGALAYLHDAALPNFSVVHRDVKPDNVGITGSRRLKLFDLGLVAFVPKGGAAHATYAMTRDTGTQRYLAPEALRGRDYNAAVDTYAFGLNAWEMLTLRKPYVNLDATLHRAVVCPPTSQRPRLPAAWSSELRSVVASCWAPEQRDRPPLADAEARLRAIRADAARPKAPKKSASVLARLRRGFSRFSRPSSSL